MSLAQRTTSQSVLWGIGVHHLDALRYVLDDVVTNVMSDDFTLPWTNLPKGASIRTMIDLVDKNAKLAFETRFRILKPDMKQVLEELQETLELPRFPARIESFDISHIQGAENVAGMVVCDNGKMNRSEYRKFKIRSVEGANDVASMREVVLRRYKRLLEEGKPLPDLVMERGALPAHLFLLPENRSWLRYFQILL